MKTCNECNTEKPLAEFSKNQSKCKPCRKEYNAAYHAAHTEERRASNAAYHAENRVELNAKKAAYYAENREEFRAKQAAYNRSPEGREARSNHPLRIKARQAVRQAVAAGTKRRPQHCCSCGSQHKGPIEAHHWRGYAEENWLDILWLCKPCHSVRA